MNGLELSKDFFNTYGKELMETQFSHVHYAAGAVGQGSEFFGFDDQLSEDHDFSAGFCVWLTKEDEEKYGYDISQLRRIFENTGKTYVWHAKRRKTEKDFGSYRIYGSSGPI